MSRKPRTRCAAWRTLAAIVLIASAAPRVGAGVPSAVSYQGRLVDGAGVPISAPTRLRFRLLLGGDDTTNPSQGTRVYDEVVTVTPGTEGVFSHMIGTGAPATACPEGICTLTQGDFGDGAIPVWIEVMVDPDGSAGTADDDVLLPRTRVGSVGYAFRVDSLDGASGGSVSGNMIVSGEATFGQGITIPGMRGLTWSTSQPYPATVTLSQTETRGGDCNLDGTADYDYVTQLCYNCIEGSPGRANTATYRVKDQWEWTWCPPSDPDQPYVEENVDFQQPNGLDWRPFAFWIQANNDSRASWTFQSSPTVTALRIEPGKGWIGMGAPSYPFVHLDLWGDATGGSGSIRLHNDVPFDGGAVYFEGNTVDSNRLRLTSEEPTGGTKQVDLPNATGRVVVVQNTSDHGVVMWGNGEPAFDTGDEVCSASSLKCVTTYSLAGTNRSCTATYAGHFHAYCKKP